MGVKVKHVYHFKRRDITNPNTNNSKPILVQRNFTPIWKERGWQQKGSCYHGFYRTKYGAFEGLIVEPFFGKIQFFIFKPPVCLKRHSHVLCFIPKGNNVYEIHFSTKAKTINEGIIAIEKILDEAHRL